MISLSELASEKIKRMAEENNCVSNIRVMVVGGGCSGLTYEIDFESEGTDDDASYESYGV